MAEENKARMDACIPLKLKDEKNCCGGLFAETKVFPCHGNKTRL